MKRLHLTFNGTVQGMGFRPYLYRLAQKYGLTGWAYNSSEGVELEWQGEAAMLEAAIKQLKNAPPFHAKPAVMHQQAMPCQQEEAGFTLRASTSETTSHSMMLPDLAPCATCLNEMNDPSNYRYRYPFIACVECGSRYSIITDAPYDRAQTTMDSFTLCDECQTEYENPANRRFHAQTIACAECGPQLSLLNGDGNQIAEKEEALALIVKALRQGKIIALKGIGGFQLLVDATNEQAVIRLRQRKHRARKPFAVMAGSLEVARELCRISPQETELLQSPAAPIMLMETKPHSIIADSVAPDNPNLGVMLPSSPLHHLLLQGVGKPMVATSGNLSDEPICKDEYAALEKLGAIADLFLVHDRPIANRVDDSVVRIMAEKPTILRRARGYVPQAITLPEASPEPILAVGGHLKNTVAWTQGNQLQLSPHIGDLGSPEACHVHTKMLHQQLSQSHVIAHDNHPNYASTKAAKQLELPTISIQHHYAHALACMAEHGITEECLAVVWDGAGYGEDGTLWGSEFLHITTEGSERVAHLRPFPLVGGDKAAQEPKRSALGLFHVAGLPLPESLPFQQEELNLLQNALKQKINCSLTSSVGRLFDAVASLTGLCQVNDFEGEAAMALEFAAQGEVEPYPFALEDEMVDWQPMLEAVLADSDNGVSISHISARFHHMLVEMIVTIAKRQGLPKIVLSGGCFQNKYLLELAVKRLQSAGFTPYWHQRIPPNDGGLAAGQAYGALRALKQRQEVKQCA